MTAFHLLDSKAKAAQSLRNPAATPSSKMKKQRNSFKGLDLTKLTSKKKKK